MQWWNACPPVSPRIRCNAGVSNVATSWVPSIALNCLLQGVKGRRHTISSSITLRGAQAAMMEWITTGRSLTVRYVRAHQHHMEHSNHNIHTAVFEHVFLGAKKRQFFEFWVMLMSRYSSPGNTVRKHWTFNPSAFLKTLCRTRGASRLKPNFPFTDRVPSSRNYLVQRINRNVLIQDSDFFSPQGSLKNK